jgi:peptidoglycan/xylan/chitin deacetylase (PgdA/CDA1 family)
MLRRRFAICVSSVVFVYDQACRVFGRTVGKPTAGSCVVLEYHSISAEQRARFAKHLDVLQRVAAPVSADVRQTLAPSQWHVAITFDDGLASFVENALPELELRGIPSTVFVVADRLGTVPNWTSYTGAMPDERMLNADELRSLPASVIVGSHGASHEKLTLLSEPNARREIAESRRQLEAILGRSVTLFSYPYGAFSEHLNVCCREAGYERIFTNLPVAAFSDPHEFVTGRVEVKPTDSLVELRLKIAGSYRWLPAAFKIKRALLRAFSTQAKRMKPLPQEVRLRQPR